ncbi:uncharacterized protein LOC128647338 [Bombina bombina]|uniref:uncharacterized protein LOC128647338 n=1 Tax=Bombina bombina TaxID=8345 RepID=UPI00235AEF5C|nr:uncharacterized protein LOC128647338 [Bombina bombina]
MFVSSAHMFYLTAAICRTQRHYIHWSLASRKFSAYSSSKTGRNNRNIPPSMDKLEDEELVFPEFVAQGKEEESVDYELRLQKTCEERIRVEQLERTKVEVVGAELYHQTLQQQVKSLQPLFKKLETKEIKSKKGLSDNIEINDLGFTPILHNTNMKRKSTKIKMEHKIYGSPDSSLPISGHQCSGCGAIMHCLEPTIPGYIPSEKYSSILEQNTNMKNVTCQRCFLLVHHQKALNVTVSQEEYRNIVSNIREKKALVLLMVDMLDIPNTIIPDLLDLVGETKNIFVLGNKIDLLPGDSPGYLKRLKGQLQDYCTKRGLNRAGNMNDVHLISAKTGYGVEELITKLQRSWKYKGDVYLVGATNAGKSTLFNALLQSDYCKAKASEIIRGATISPWPEINLITGATWWRFIDDVFGIWYGDIGALLAFVEDLNCSVNGIKFTLTYDECSIHFLDTKAYKGEDGLKIDIYSKPTDKNNTLWFESFHPPSTFTAVPKSQLLRVDRIVSDSAIKEVRLEEMSDKFISRGYPKSLIKDIKQNVSATRDESKTVRITKNGSKNLERIKFISQYNTRSNQINKIIRKCWHILSKCHPDIGAFSLPPMLAYKRSPNTKDKLVRADIGVKKNVQSTITGQKRKGCYQCLSCINCNSMIKGDTFCHPYTGCSTYSLAGPVLVQVKGSFHGSSPLDI